MRLSDRDMVKAVRAFAGIGFRICDRCQSIYWPGNEGYASDYIKLCDECLKEAGAIRVESLGGEVRLETVDPTSGRWLEITEDTLEEYFEEVPNDDS